MQSFRHGLGEVSQASIIDFLPLTTTAKPETKKSLPVALFRCVRKAFLAAVIPRIFSIFFRYSQPILIKESIRYVVADSLGTENHRGYWLIVSAMGIYVGLAVRDICLLCFVTS
jgi:hypothetical protein